MMMLLLLWHALEKFNVWSHHDHVKIQLRLVKKLNSFLLSTKEAHFFSSSV